MCTCVLVGAGTAERLASLKEVLKEISRRESGEGEVRSQLTTMPHWPNGVPGSHLRLRQEEQGSCLPGPTVRLVGPRARRCQPHSLLGNTQHHLHNPRSKSRYFIISFFLFKSKLKINVPSVLRCISLLQPAHIPSRCPFQNMAGERRKEMNREREPVHRLQCQWIAPLPRRRFRRGRVAGGESPESGWDQGT